VLELEGYGLLPGCHADLIVLQADDPIEALRLRAVRTHVVRRGAVIAETAPQTTALSLGRHALKVDFRRPPPGS